MAPPGASRVKVAKAVDSKSRAGSATPVEGNGFAWNHGDDQPEIAPDEDKWSRVPLGFPPLAGLTYPVPDLLAKNKIIEDSHEDGKWYATARRDLDGALVGVFWAPSEKAWYYVDQEQVSVGRLR